MLRLSLLGCILLSSLVGALEQGPKGSIVEQTKSERIYRGVVFAEVDDVPLSLDLYFPKKKEDRPHLVVFFHGDPGGPVPRKVVRCAGLSAMGMP